MKKYIMMALVALSAMTMSTSCSSDYEPDSYLSEVKVSSSYLDIDKNGGSTTITLNAADSWSFTSIPDWLTITPASGNAGETTVTFSAKATSQTNTATVKVVCGGKQQLINVQQITEKVETPVSTCADVNSKGVDGTTYRVKGTVTAITSTSYGNMYIDDGTDQVYVYGTLDASGAEKNFSSLGIDVGDNVTVEGPRSTYGTTVELVNVTVINIEKSLIKLDSLAVDGVKCETLPIEGGDIVAVLTNKGGQLSASVPEDAQSWLSVTGLATQGTTSLVQFHAQPNTGGDRSTSVSFATYSNNKIYTAVATISQKGAIVACTVSEFNEMPVGDAQYRITAVVSSVYNAAKGRFYIKDYSGETYVYNMSGFEAMGVKAGDIITIVGKRAQYNTTIEMTEAVIEDHTPVTEISIADFLTKEDSKTDYYMVTGSISSIANETYGNLYLSDGTNELYVYGCYPGYGATGDYKKNFLESAGIVAGDQLTMIGYKQTYNGVIELCGGIYFSHVSANPVTE